MPGDGVPKNKSPMVRLPSRERAEAIVIVVLKVAVLSVPSAGPDGLQLPAVLQLALALPLVRTIHR